MTSSRRPREESPAAAEIEELLRSWATDDLPARRGDRVVTTHAVWLCACETFDAWDEWVVFAVGEDGIGWFRLPLEGRVEDVVDAERLAGHHPAPEGVLAWLRGDDPDPWRSQDEPDGAEAFAEVHRRIRNARREV